LKQKEREGRAATRAYEAHSQVVRDNVVRLRALRWAKEAQRKAGLSSLGARNLRQVSEGCATSFAVLIARAILHKGAILAHEETVRLGCTPTCYQDVRMFVSGDLEHVHTLP
jgi:hypothetical protein